MNQITQEQAVQVLKWMDADWEKIEGVFHVCGVDGREYLYSDPGQSEVMDRLEKEEWDVENRRAKITMLNSKGIGRRIGLSKRSLYRDATAKTRPHALLLAVLELLKTSKLAISS